MSIKDLLNLFKKLPKFVKDLCLAVLQYFLLWGTEDSDLSGEEEVREICGNVHVRELVNLCRDGADIPTVRVHRLLNFKTNVEGCRDGS